MAGNLVWNKDESEDMTSLQSNSLQSAATISSAASIIFIVYTVWMRRGETELSFPNKLIAFEMLLNLIMSFATLPGRCGSIDGCSEKFCHFQGFVVELSGFASHCWMAFVAWKMYQWIVLKKHEDRLRKKLPSTFGTIALAALIITIIITSNDKIGQCAAWCWVNGEKRNNISEFRMWGYYAWLIGSWSFNVIVLIFISLFMRKSAISTIHFKQRLALEAAVQDKLTLYIFVFSFCWFFSVLDFVIEFCLNKGSNERPIYFPSSLAAAIFTPLHGFGNCLVYHGYLDSIIPWLKRFIPQFIQLIFSHSPWLANHCSCCISTNDTELSRKGNEPKKFVVRRASTINTPVTLKPESKRKSILDRFAMYAETAVLGAAAGGASKAKSPLNVSAIENSQKNHRVNFSTSSFAISHESEWRTEPDRFSIVSRDFTNDGSITGQHQDSHPQISNVVSGKPINHGRLRNVTASGYAPQSYSIFVTTFNMGEAKLASFNSTLGDWILRGHDIYSIGVQECLDLASVREAIHSHLGGPDEYKMFSTEIGSDNTNFGYHGFIALTVFVRTSDFNSGYVRETIRSTSAMATGQNLIITTAQNKGAVGIPFQIHDTSVAFLASHLPSDQKGVSKLAKRNNAASTILKEVVLAPEDVDFDMHLQHDHVFFTGDLNYRMNQEADGGYLSSIIDACRTEKSELGDDPQWLARKYSLLRSPKGDDPMYPKSTERNLILAAKARSSEQWIKILEYDELRLGIQQGDVFSCFDEELPAFPPTYKRMKAEKGSDGGCGDYSDLNEFMHGFSHTGADGDKERSDTASDDKDRVSGRFQFPLLSDGESRLSSRGNLKDIEANGTVELTPTDVEDSRGPKGDKSKKNLRPPSYTDRILIHSLTDRQAKLNVIAYDFCDLVRASDHRPVSMVCHLEVNAAVIFPTNFAQPLTMEELRGLQDDPNLTTNPMAVNNVMHTVVGSDKLYLFELCISHLSVDLIEGAGGEVEPVHANSSSGEFCDSESSRSPDEYDDRMIMHSRVSESGKHISSATMNPVLDFSRSGPNSRDSIPDAAGDNHSFDNNKGQENSSIHFRGEASQSKLKLISSYFSWLLHDEADDCVDSDIKEIEVVFPIPSKDPICREKSTYKMAKAFGVGNCKEDDDLIR